MTGFGSVVGHARAVRVIRRSLASGRIPHAYLFWGPEGIGKELTARAFASVLLCADPGALASGEPCGVCPSCRKSGAGSHPDLHLVAPGEKAISVEEVRALQERLSFQAYEKGRKIVIIRDAHRMSASGANALLKTVEEPPRDTFIVLLAPQGSLLLPTLVSRCQALRFDALTEEEVRSVLLSLGSEPGETASLAALSDGSPGAALALEGTEAREAADEAAAVARELPALDIALRFDLADRWAKEKALLDLRLTSLERALAARARLDEGAAARLERLYEVRGLLQRNVNAQLALDALFVLDAGTRLEEMI